MCLPLDIRIGSMPIESLQGRVDVALAHRVELLTDFPWLGIHPPREPLHELRSEVGKFPHNRPETGVELDNTWSH